jgi:drug/metabolite transporter (DMT)-like permease
MGAGAWPMLLALSVLWGGSFFFQAVAVQALGPMTVVALRVLIAAVAMWAALAALGTALPRGRAVWVAFLGMGLLNNAIPFTLIVWGQQHVASGLAAILNATTPLFTVLVAHALTPDERITRAKLAGVALGFAGVVVMLGGAALEGAGLALWAQLACLGGALAYAFAGVFGRRFRRMGLAPAVTAAGQVTASSLVMLPLALWVERPWERAMPGAEVLAALLGLGLLSTALAYLLYFRLLAVAGAVNLLLVTFLIPVTAIWLGVAVLGEALTLRQLAGMALVGAGLAAMDGRPLGWARARLAPR